MNNTTNGEIQVWLASEAADRRAMHDVIAVFTAGYTYVYESAGWAAEGPVAALLSAAGLRSGGASALTVREVPCDVRIVLQRGFSASESHWAKIHEALTRAMTGQLGGFFPVLASQAFYHRSAVAFDYAWAAAGRPPVEVRHPDLVAGRQAEDGTPGPVDRAAKLDVRVLSARPQPVGNDAADDVQDPWTRGPIEGEDPGDEELWPTETPV